MKHIFISFVIVLIELFDILTNFCYIILITSVCVRFYTNFVMSVTCNMVLL